VKSHFLSTPLDLKTKKIWVVGHTGMVGSALMRALAKQECELLSVPKESLDLRRQDDVEDWMASHKPDMVLLAAAKVGGIGANMTYPAEFLYDNIAIASNIIHSSYKIAVKRLVFLGSSCIYPKEALQPIKEDALMSGYLEPTNEAYAIAKITGLKLCEMYHRQYGCDFFSVMPCNLYGRGDRYHEMDSHVIPAMIMKLHKAKMAQQKTVTLWGTGKPLREFLNVDDLAEGIVFLLKYYAGHGLVNIGSGQEISISALARLITEIVVYKGAIEFDASKPDGTMRKVLDCSLLDQSNWQPEISLKDGLKAAYQDFLERTALSHAA
jgi:GDP-L-fucose synthase